MPSSKLVLAVLALLLYSTVVASAPQAPTPTASASLKVPSEKEAAAAKLPVRRVILYKTGVGYFEHVGQVRGSQSVQIDFTSGQLNDVLQSLTVLDLNGGRIAAVNYNSEAPLSQRLGMLRLPLGENTDLSKFYASLRGARLDVRAGATAFTGRLLSVERKTRVTGGATLDVDLATLVSDSGEVHSVELTPAVSVRLVEGDVTQEVSQYLSLLASLRQEDLRRMTIATAGTGDRQLYVSYISETPIWKTTYRVVLPANPKDEPLLQGWAIVDNTVGQDWNNVELSLVAGIPQSFIQQLSQPYYGRRTVVPLPQFAQLAPQTHESAMLEGSPSLAGGVTDQTESPGVSAGAPSNEFRADSLAKAGGLAGRIAPRSQASLNSPMAGPGMIAAARNAASAAAQAGDLGDLFEYKLTDRVTIHKNESALVPIVHVPVAAEKVSLWNSSLNSPRPLRALWLTNATPLTLDGGSFTVIEGEAFAGEGLIEATKPGEKRLLSYAVDLGLRVDARAEGQPLRVTRVRIVRGVLIQTSEMRQETSYTIRNDDVASRSLLIEHPLRPAWKLSDASPKPEETTSNLYRFRKDIDPKSSASFTVSESAPTETRFELTNLTSDQILLFERQKSITPELEAALRKIIEQKGQIAALDAQIASKNDENKRIFADQDRLRENLKALKGTPEERALTQRYTQQLADQETRLEAIQRETADLTTRRSQAQSALDSMISSLVLDSTF